MTVRQVLVSLCRNLPEKLSQVIYYRLLKGKVAVGGREVHLRYAPRCSIRLPESNDFMYEAIFCTGSFEGQISRIIYRNALASGLFCDVGSNIGYYSLIWLSASTDNQAVLVEADSRLAILAHDNMVQNYYNARATVHACAAGEKPGQLGLHLYGDKVTGWARLTEDNGNGTQKVNVVSLDELMNGREVSFLKVDVEGAEPLVFRGARLVLANRALKGVVFESNEPGSAALDVDPAESHEILKQYGFYLTPLGETKPVMNWLAVRESM